MTNPQNEHSLDVDVETTREMRDEAIALRSKFDDFINRLDKILYNDSNRGRRAKRNKIGEP